jgi:hypothetical protein
VKCLGSFLSFPGKRYKLGEEMILYEEGDVWDSVESCGNRWEFSRHGTQRQERRPSVNDADFAPVHEVPWLKDVPTYLVSIEEKSSVLVTLCGYTQVRVAVSQVRKNKESRGARIG